LTVLLHDIQTEYYDPDAEASNTELYGLKARSSQRSDRSGDDDLDSEGDEDADMEEADGLDGETEEVSGDELQGGGGSGVRRGE
jgi:hypothetical protein